MNPDDSKPDNSWSSLAAAWQAQPVDLDALRRATTRRSRRMKLLMALDVAGALVLALIAVHLFLSNASTEARLGAAVGIASMAAAVLINYRLRRGLWQATGDNAVDLLKLQRQRCVNAVRMALWGPLFLPLGALTGVLLARGKAVSDVGWQWLPLYKLVLLAIFITAFGIGTALYVRRQRRRIAAIDAHLAQMDSSG